LLSELKVDRALAQVKPLIKLSLRLIASSPSLTTKPPVATSIVSAFFGMSAGEGRNDVTSLNVINGSAFHLVTPSPIFALPVSRSIASTSSGITGLARKKPTEEFSSASAFQLGPSCTVAIVNFQNKK
jgi:hypothetical protein